MSFESPLRYLLISMIVMILITIPVVAMSTGYGGDHGDDHDGGSFTIQIPLILFNLKSLDFGTIQSGSSPSVVTISTDNTRSLSSGNATLLSSHFHAAKFKVIGAKDHDYTITLPSNMILTSGSHTMVASNFTDSEGGSARLHKLFFALGYDIFRVGADLEIGANQPSGSYNGNFSVTVSYL